MIQSEREADDTRLARSICSINAGVTSAALRSRRVHVSISPAFFTNTLNRSCARCRACVCVCVCSRARAFAWVGLLALYYICKTIHRCLCARRHACRRQHLWRQSLADHGGIHGDGGAIRADGLERVSLDFVACTAGQNERSWQQHE